MDGTVALKDDGDRRAAIADHGRSILVEAGAGSGKTAIMAGRVAMLLANGAAAKSIAAVTFTELAASELLSRIQEFVAELLDGKVPAELRMCLPQGLAASQRDCLSAAAQSIDEIVCATIHGFCQRLIKPYPVEAGIDPGAKVADRSQADLIFSEVADAWLRERLSGDEQSLLSEMVIEDVDGAMETIGTILDCMRKHRDLAGPAGRPLQPLAEAYRSAVRTFHDFVVGSRIREPESIEWANHFKTHAEALPPAPYDDDASVMGLLRSKLDGGLFTSGGSFYAFRKKGKWESAGKSIGVGKAQAGLLHDEASGYYGGCCKAWTDLAGAIGAAALGRLIGELKPAIARFQAQKRAVGLLDFDDLIQSALDLLRNHDDVRAALAKRYRYVLVDEFQDTDPGQAEVFWRLCGDPLPGADPSDWRRFVIRPGALFAVGDPKQGIYRFRGADVAAYVEARKVFLAAEAKGVISTNFRSRPKVLKFVNERFAGVLSAPSQPGFTALDPFHPDLDGHCGVVALDVDIGGVDAKPNAETRRDAEAEAVAEMCDRMIGRAQVYDHKAKAMRTCRAGDIALLAPTSTNLWRYESALENRGIAVATQAGKGLFRRQEIQDLVALTRVLADGRDTLALGALLRGPLVGLTEEQLLDIVWNLPRPEQAADGIPPLSLAIEPDQVADPYAREVVRKLRYMRSLANATTPHSLLSQAVDMFNVRAMLAQRHLRQAERALANVDLYLEISKAYAVRGLRAFAEAMTASWKEARTEGGKAIEGRADVQEEAVALYTMHASKGGEWPVVVPINTMGPPHAIKPEVVNRAEGRLFLPIFGVFPDGYDVAHAAEKAEVERERVRLWYVTATRARELLVLPRPSVPIVKNAWGAVVDFELEKLPALVLPERGGALASRATRDVNGQTRADFAAEAAAVTAAHRGLKWSAPSRDEGPRSAGQDSTLVVAPAADGDAGMDEAQPSPQGGRDRGLVMHKLFEEVLNAEVDDGVAALSSRAAELIVQIGQTISTDASAGLSPAEIASCISRTLALPEVAALRPSLVPELPVYACETVDKAETATAGIADAVSYGADGKPRMIVDWKSDVSPDTDAINRYGGQVRAYLDATGVDAGLIVFVTTGKIIRISRSV